MTKSSYIHTTETIRWNVLTVKIPWKYIIYINYASSYHILNDFLGVLSIFHDIFPYFITIKNQVLVQIEVSLCTLCSIKSIAVSDYSLAYSLFYFFPNKTLKFYKMIKINLKNCKSIKKSNLNNLMEGCDCYSRTGHMTIRLSWWKSDTTFGSYDNAEKFYKNVGFSKLIRT
jgi:hypothetical protein